ncbi:acyltransferase [Bacillus sp. 3255]|uniref:acyltransferase family protein n=1 Tax=Bacillus sp. 3255 TaxID=2817904 RepID=UPI00285D8D6E|nr:acyltransferase [Bacillus sp. 3255]MDR6878726.1 peptidoglycan/LPS O-acetylase OafA/YrhL [Bacillus sp. 3255]
MSHNQKIGLQASRGAAAFFVMLFHISAMSYKYYQYDFLGVSAIGRSGGVDFFFILTGFLLFHTYGHKIGSKMNIIPYLTNRIIRIYPFYWLMTFIVLPVYFLVPSFGYGYETHKDTIVKSFVLLPQTHGPVLPVAWSLSYFILFYVAFGMLMALRKKSAYILASIWIVLTLCHVLQVPFISTDIDRHFYLNFLFSDVNLEFLLGCLVAKCVAYVKPVRFKPWIVLGFLGFVFIWINNRFQFVPYHSYLLYMIPSVCILIGASSIPEDFRLPAWGIMLSKLGDASYTILLTHLLFISVLMKLSVVSHLAGRLGYWFTDLIIVVVVIPLCLLAYKLAEKPLVSLLKAVLASSSYTLNTKRLPKA